MKEIDVLKRKLGKKEALLNEMNGYLNKKEAEVAALLKHQN